MDFDRSDNMKKQNKRNFLETAIRQINAPCPEKITAEMLIACIRGEKYDKKWKPHLWAFLEELDVALIHDIVLSGELTFEEISRAVDIWECLDVPTTRWIREMAELRMEAAA